MSLAIVIRIEAEQDLTDAALHYEHHRAGLGQSFLDDIATAISNAAENPFRFPCLRRKPEVRRVLSSRFPYRMFFIRRSDRIVVFRVLHAARHDRGWRASIPPV